MDRLLAAMQATGGSCVVQLALTPTPAWFERSAKQRFKRREQRASPERKEGPRETGGRTSEVDAAELRGALEVQHRPLFFAEVRVVAPTRTACEAVAAVLRTSSAENQLVERGTTVRQALLRPYDRRVSRGEGNPLPGFQRGVFASSELAMLWQLPSAELTAVPLERSSLPVAPAPPAIARPVEGEGLLSDAHGPVTIEPDLR